MSEAPELAPESIEPVTLESILDDAAPTLEAEIADAAASSVNRDENGRFAPRAAEEPAPAAAAPVAPAAPEPVRLSADEWAALSRSQPVAPSAPAPAATEPEKPARTPFWEDPEKAVRELAQEMARDLVSPVQQQFQAFIVERSEQRAIREHGEEPVKAAAAAIDEFAKTNPAEVKRIAEAAMRSTDPIGLIMKWHKQYEAGKDPKAFAINQAKQLLADPAQRANILKELGLSEGEAPAPEAPRAPAARVVLPPSLSKVPSGRGQPTDNDMSDSALFSFATH